MHPNRRPGQGEFKPNGPFPMPQQEGMLRLSSPRPPHHQGRPSQDMRVGLTPQNEADFRDRHARSRSDPGTLPPRAREQQSVGTFPRPSVLDPQLEGAMVYAPAGGLAAPPAFVPRYRSFIPGPGPAAVKTRLELTEDAPMQRLQQQGEAAVPYRGSRGGGRRQRKRRNHVSTDQHATMLPGVMNYVPAGSEDDSDSSTVHPVQRRDPATHVDRPSTLRPTAPTFQPATDPPLPHPYCAAHLPDSELPRLSAREYNGYEWGDLSKYRPLDFKAPELAKVFGLDLAHT